MHSERKYIYDFPRPGLTVDIVVYAIVESKLRILLIERGIQPFKGCWALPGGFVNEGENIYQAADRELYEETNLIVPNLQQFFVASDPGRDPRGWTVSSVFMGFINKSFHEAKAGDDAKNLKWFPVNDLPSLAFDHAMILEKAMQLLQKTIYQSIIDKELLPEIFQLSDITFLLGEMGITPETAMFLSDRLLGSGALIKLDNKNYKFDDLVYDRIKKQGFPVG